MIAYYMLVRPRVGDRPGLQPAVPGRPALLAAGDPDPAGNRRHRADAGHGHRRQRADQRAHPRRTAQWFDAASGDPHRLRARLRHHSRLQHHDPDCRHGAADFRLRPGARLCGGALPGHHDLAVLGRGRLARDDQPDLRPPPQGRVAGHRPGLETGQRSGSAPSNRTHEDGILPHQKRHPVHAPCAGVQRHLAAHFPAGGVLPLQSRSASLGRVHRRHADRAQLRAGGQPRKIPRRARQGGLHRLLGTELRLQPGRADPPAAQGRAEHGQHRRVGDAGARRRSAGRHAAPRRVRRPAGRQGTGRKRRPGAAAGDHRHRPLPGLPFRVALLGIGDHRQPARRDHHSRLLRLLPVGVLALGAGGGAGRPRLLGQRVGGRFRPRPRDLQERCVA
jgi:hypothetical protein